MARNIFALNPNADSSLALGAVKPADPAQGQDVQSAIDGIATRYNVPANVLLAIAQSERDQDPAQAAQRAERNAKEIAQATSKGVPIDQYLRLRTGSKEAGTALMNSAYDIADQLYPDPERAAADAKKGTFGDLAKHIGGSVVKAAGSTVKGLGIAAEEVATGGFGSLDAGPSAVRNGADWLGDRIREGGDYLQGGVSDAGKQALADSAPDGDLFKPSTWTFGKSPSLKGYAMLGADVLGSFLPVVATAVLTRSPTATAAVGGAMGGGAGAEQASTIVQDMARQKGKSGKSLLEENSAFYREALASGKTPDEALEATTQAAERMAFLMTAPISAFGGAATEKILERGAVAVGSKALAARVAGKAGLSALEEGTQEAAETIATNAGVSDGADMPMDLTKGTFGDFILGALGGAGPGAASGIPGGFQRQAPAEAAPAPADMQDPADYGDMGGQDAAGIAAAPTDIQESVDDGSIDGQGAVPASLPPAETPEVLGAAPSPSATDLPAVPKGPIATAAALAPDLTPQPEAPPPAVRFPDQKPGAAIRLQDDTGVTHDAVILREDPEGIAVRIAGSEILIEPAEFDRARVAANQADEAAKVAEKKGDAPASAAPLTPPVPSLTQIPAVPDTRAPETVSVAAPTDAPKLSEQATAAIKPPKEKAAKPKMAPEAALKAMAVIEETAARGGWNKRLTTKHAELAAIAGVNPSERVTPTKSIEKPKPAPKAATKPTAAPVEPAPARPIVTPMEPDPANRLQPDMLGGKVVTEEDMAAKERRKREWGQFLGIAEHGKSGWDGSLEGRGVRIRPGKVRILASDTASDRDFTLDTQGMSRDQIASEVRGALSQMDRSHPLQSAQEAEAPPAPAKVTTPAKQPSANDLRAGHAKNNQVARHELPGRQKMGVPTAQYEVGKDQNGEYMVSFGFHTATGGHSSPMSGQFGSAADAESHAKGKIAEQANTVLRDKNKTYTEQDKADATKALKWLGVPMDGTVNKAPAAQEKAPISNANVESAPTAPNDGLRLTTKKQGRDAGAEWARQGKPEKWADDPAMGNASNDAKGGWTAGYRATIQEASKADAPTATEVAKAAAETNPSPTPAQAEAENYKTGKVDWRGLTLSIENAKGSIRSKVGANGVEWSVTMPAHYGRILSTTGADGDHIDFYMGDEPASERVVIVNQIDLGTGAFDEHKIMLGFGSTFDALRAYEAGFSDGKGKDRIGSFTETTAFGFMSWLNEADLKKPTEPVKETQVEVPAPAAAPVQKPAYGAENKLVSVDRAAELRARLKDKLKNQLNAGMDPEIIAIGTELAVFHIEAGARKFVAFAQAIAADLGTTPDKLRPYLRGWYNGARDMMEDSGASIEAMDAPEDVREALAGMGTWSNPSQKVADGAISEEEAPAKAQESATDEQNSNSGVDPAGLDGEQSVEPVDDGGQDNGGGRGRKSREDAPADAGDAGNIPAGSMVGDGAGNSGDTAAERTGESPGNYVIEPGFALGDGTPSKKIAGNIAAIRLALDLEKSNRHATKAEQDILAGYVGWGGLKRVFDPRETGKTSQWGRAQAELNGLLDQRQYLAAQRSTADAHYTSRLVVESMWGAMQRMGFTGGRALEPTVGSGNFLGLQPRGLAENTEWFATELDKITGIIAKHLYPDATILPATGFQDAPFQAGSFDVAIGNPPFGSDVLTSDMDPEIPPLSVHNFIIAKTGVLLRPGGIMGMVVTNRFLDLPDSEARTYLNQHFNFLGAVRLPNTAFKANAGTEVTTDIVWFQKRRPGEAAGDQSWMRSEVKDGVKMNGYFAEHPEMMLGRPSMDGTMYGGKEEFTLHDDGRDLEKSLPEALGKIDAKLPDREGQLIDALAAQKATSDLATGEAALLDDGRVVVRRDDRAAGAVLDTVDANTPWGPDAEEWTRALDAVQASHADPLDAAKRDIAANALADTGAFLADGSKRSKPTQAQEAIYALSDGAISGNIGKAQRDALAALQKKLDAKRLGAKKFAALRGLLNLRRDTRALLVAEAADAPNIEAKRRKLREDYRAFVAAHGFVNSRSNDAILNGVPGVEAALEANYKPADKLRGTPETAKEASILSKRIIQQTKGIGSVESAADGVHVSLQHRGKLDIPFIADLVKSAPEKVISDLTSGDSPRIFRDPVTDDWVLADEYLSGDLAEKIEQARRAGEVQNVRHLEAAMPPPKAKEQITPTIRSMWIPADVFKDFLQALGYKAPSVIIDAKGGRFVVEAKGDPNDFGKQFATPRRSPLEIMQSTVKGKALIVYDTTAEKKLVKNEQATQDANAAADRLQAEFQKWVWLSPDREAAVVDAYNTKMNVVVPRRFDGVRYLTQVGANPAIQLRNSQKNGAWRMMLSDSTLLHHVVGAGKTFTAITAIMERKRLGLSRKTLVSVPNHIVGQWARDFYALYPGARILAASEKDFEAKNRRKLLSRIATGDYDAIIIGHSSLRYIENAEEDVGAVMAEQLSDLKETLDAAKRDGSSGRSVSQIADRIEKYEARIEATLAKLNTDGLGFDFAKTGIDNLVIDEAHEFKNLEYSTAADRLVGMNDPQGSQRAFDLYLKTRSLKKRQGAVGFLTGTPVSNSLVEVYSVMKYLAPEILRQRGIMHYDSWAASFVQSKTRFEMTAAQKLKERNVLMGLHNLSTLAQIYRSFADVVMRPEVEAMYREQMEEQNRRDGTNLSTRFPTPKVRGGKRKLVKIKASAQQEEFTDYLVLRMEGIKRNASDKEYPKKDNPLWVLSDAKKASVDMRGIDPYMPRQNPSKVTVAGDSIIAKWKRWDSKRGTQMIFCDTSVPTKTASAGVKKFVTGALEMAGLSKDRVRTRLAADAAAKVSWSMQWANAIEEVEARLDGVNLTEAQRDKIEDWLSSEDANSGASMAGAADSGFSFYDDLKAYLTENGIPADQIAFIHDYATPERKASLFDAMNEGEIRVLIGSTFKMGAGTNAQRRLVALHHIDAPWRPSDMEQREGRIIRQGNAFYEEDPDGFEVDIEAYTTEKTSDTVLWTVLERKASGIEGFLNATADSMIEDDQSDAEGYAAFMAQSTGNPIFLEKMQTEKAVRDAKSALASQLMVANEAKEFIRELPARRAAAKSAVRAAEGLNFDRFKDAGKFWTDYRDAHLAYVAARDAHKAETDRVRQQNEALAAGEPRAKLPVFELSPPEIFGRKLDGWGKAIVDGIDEVMARSDVSITISEDVTVHLHRARAIDTDVFSVSAYLQVAQTDIPLTDGAVTAKNLLKSRALIGALSIDRIKLAADELAKAKKQQLARLDAAEPDQLKKAASSPDTSALRNQERQLKKLTGQVRIAEVAAAQKRKGKINRFAQMDAKARDLREAETEVTVKPKAGTDGLSVVSAGHTWTAKEGYPAGYRSENSDGAMRSSLWLDATDGAGGRALVLAVYGGEEKSEADPSNLEAVDLFDLGNAPKESRFLDREPVATLSGDELGAWEDMRQLGRKTEAWYRANLIGQTIINKETGHQVKFTGAGARKVGGRKGEDLMKIVPALPAIIADGRIMATETDRSARNNIKAWHTIGARVLLNGAPKDVVVKVSETTDGMLHYDLSRDMSDGARFSRTSIADVSGRYGLEDSPDAINLTIADPESNDSAMDPVALDRAEATARAALAAVGIDGAVKARFDKQRPGVAGSYRNGVIGLVMQENGDWRRTLDHEIIHSLRDGEFWGGTYGLFNQDEWRALVRAARADAGIVARVEAAYSDRPTVEQTEEMVAELYADWASKKRVDTEGPLAKAFQKVRSFFRALAAALRGEGFVDAAAVMEKLASGEIGGRGPDGPGKTGRSGAERQMRQSLMRSAAAAKGYIGSASWKNLNAYASSVMTDAMGGKGGINTLSVVPGRVLLDELGKRLMSAKAYLRTKERMDSLRNDWHSRSDDVAQKWLVLRRKDPRGNDAFMDLMHRTTMAGIDPSKPDMWQHALANAARKEVSQRGDNASVWATEVLKQVEGRRQSYSGLKAEFEALPEEYQTLYQQVRNEYDAMGDAFEAAVLENMENSAKIALRRAERLHAKEMRRIQDEGLEGDEYADAAEAADKSLAAVKKRGGWGAKARIASLRKSFESNRLKGPYFPLARFGRYFVTVRNEKGKVVSFSRFEKETEQKAFMQRAERGNPGRVQHGVIDDAKSLRDQVDPTFVADVEMLLAQSGAGNEVMDAIWQRWLETLPDQSIRTSKIHRKGTEGFNKDAYRAYGKHMFHGAHQLARLKYGILLEDHMDEAELEAAHATDPNRAGLVVAEMRRRHDFVMNPTGSVAVAKLSGLAFVWYLGATPASAIANMTQTTVVGVPLMSARFKKAGVTGSLKAITRASRDFMRGRGNSWSDQWTAENSAALTRDERIALQQAYARGVVDKTQAHDLASVAESGIEYNAVREKWMRRIGWFFHHAERFNREVTFLANYRLAKDEGLSAAEAIDAAADLTWKIHFDYQNTSRPRVMQSDIGKILTTFRQFTVNMLWRLFRDTHQSLHGATAEERSEARAQLIGITLSLMAHAGIRGTWGFGLLMMLLGMVFPGDDDDAEKWLQDALLMEGDSLGVAAWNYGMGAALNGIPGQALGIDLRERIGMPNLWFRGPSRELEGSDLYTSYVTEILGPVFGIGEGLFRGASVAFDGDVARGAESMLPKAARDLLKAGRYATSGVTTKNGDTLVEDVSPLDVLRQAIGFTPAKIAERYDINTRLKNEEARIMDERKALHKKAGDALREGKPLPASVIEGIRDFNSRYPEYPITGDTIQQSVRSRMRASDRNEFGIQLNAKLNDRLRSAEPPAIYN